MWIAALVLVLAGLAPSSTLHLVMEPQAGEKSSGISCDGRSSCPDGRKCCRHPTGTWTCCSYYDGVCCLDGAHCCPAGTYCDLTYTKCLRQGLRYPFSPRLPPASVPSIQMAEAEDKVEEPKVDVELSFPALPVSPVGVWKGSSVSVQSQSEEGKGSMVRCDGKISCPDKTTCCRHPAGTWTCCIYYAGVCCLDGAHCCPAGTYCDLTYTKCLRQGLRYPFSPRLAAASIPSIQMVESRDSVEE